MPRLRSLRLVAVLLPLAVGLAACGGSGDSQQADATVSTPPARTHATTPSLTTTTATTPPATTTSPATTPAAPQNGGATTPATTTPSSNGGATPAPDQPSTTPSQHSGGGSAPAGCGNAVGGFIKGVQASGVDCGQATGVATAWYDAVNQGAEPGAPIDAAGYACSGNLADERATVSCTGGDGARVSFTASP